MNDRTSRGTWLCFEGEAKPEWLDQNGHVNFKRYFGLVNAAADQVMLKDLAHVSNAPHPDLFFTLSARIRYAAELKAGDQLRVTAQPLDRTDKTLRLLIRIERTDPAPGLSAECEWTGAYIDDQTRRIRPLPEGAREAFDAKLHRSGGSNHDPPVFPQGLKLPDVPDDQRLLTSSGRISRDAIDAMGHVGLEQYMFIFMLSNIGFLNALGMNRQIMNEQHWGKFVLNSEIEYLAELCENDDYRIFTRMLWVRRKTCAYQHHLYRLRPAPQLDEKEEILAGTCTNTMAIADLKTRRIIPLPNCILSGLERIHSIPLPADSLP